MRQSELQQELDLVKQDFQTTLQAKNHQILQLQHSLNKANIRIKTLEQKLLFVDSQHSALSQKFTELELYSKERSHALTHKNMRILQLEESMEEELSKKQSEMQGHIDKLLEVVRSQEQELSVYLLDHQNYVQSFEQLWMAHRELQAEKNLLSEYNSQLQKQVGDLQTHSSSLQSWAAHAHQQLSAQNEQAGDLLSQVEFMMESK